MSIGYQESLDEIFRTYMAVKPLVKHKADREFRKPQIILDLARDLGLFPPAMRVVKITGSKGKGTTTRLIAAGLWHLCPAEKVGMVVSPEEDDHVDRMRINGVAISRERFAVIFSSLLPLLKERERKFEPGEYFSPSGLFLLIALQWFCEEGVEWFVLEGGRGARWDEVGNIPSQVSVVTSIFGEHLDCLGPTVADVAREKLAVSENSDLVVLGDSASDWNGTLGLVPIQKIVTISGGGDETPSAGLQESWGGCPSGFDAPNWFVINRELARLALGGLLGRKVRHDEIADARCSTPSFGFFSCGVLTGVYECLIARDSFDVAFYRSFVAAHEGRGVVVASLPDDKDLEGLVSLFEREVGIPVVHVPLNGTRGYLDYHETLARYPDRIVETVGVGDVSRFAAVLNRVALQYPGASLIVVGTQSYIRLFRRLGENMSGRNSDC